MVHHKDIRRRNVSSSPYLSSRVLDSSSTAPNYDGYDLPAHDFPIHNDNPHLTTSHQDSEVEDVLAPGDIVGKGSLLRGDVVSLLPTHNDEDQEEQFQVIKELGKGSYAVVYLVHRVFSTRAHGPSSRGRSNTADSSEDGHILGHMDSEEPLTKPKPKKTYGRKFAIKCLSKANLDKEQLDIQMTEVTIHQSLPLHPNIVALHKTLQTSSYLLLVLEYVPGEDLFYFLQQARDHYPSPPFPVSDSQEDLSQQTLLLQQTPPTPSLLASSHPSQLLSRTRLRLIASMFAQMCDAVAACHAVGVFHRDIKPENFIVTDGRYLDEGADRINGSKSKGRVVVKLTDFGLSTREEECSDMDCGSAPYMSYECRNNVAPTYRPREADVWSLGIVLINMLYHINPWTDTAHGACPSFTAFCQEPVVFFTRLFMGMTTDVAEMLAWRVFGVDTEQTRLNGKLEEKRMTAAELGVWVRSSLVDLLAMDESSRMGGGSGPSANGGPTARVVVNGGHRLSLQMRISHHPVSRAASPFGRLFGSVGGVGGLGGPVPSPRLIGKTLSRAPSLAPAIEKEECGTETEGEVTVQERGPEERREQQQEQLEQQGDETEGDATPSPPSRASTTTKRRKRGARKKKGSTPAVPVQQQDHQEQRNETLKTLADASQSLARELSNAKAPSIHQFQLHQQQPSSSSLLTPVSNSDLVNEDARRTSLSSTLSSTSGISEGAAVLTTPPLSMMSMGTSIAAIGRTTASNTAKPSLKPSANSSNSSRMASNGSLLRPAIATGAGGGRSKARPMKIYEPVSMYAIQSPLLSKSMGAGGERGTKSGAALSVAPPGSGFGMQTPAQQEQEQLQPKAVVKRPSKWILRFGKNNSSSSGGGNNAASTSAAATPPTLSNPINSSPVAVPPVAGPSASDSGLGQGQARRSRLIPISAPGHALAFSRADPAVLGYTAETLARMQPTHAQSMMSPTVTNVTNLMMDLNPASGQQPSQQNGSSGSLVGGPGSGGYTTSATSWSRERIRGRRGNGTVDSMAILSGAAAGEGRSSPYKSSSRSPGRDAPSLASGFGSSASSSSISLVSGTGSGMDLGRGQQDGWGDGGWYRREKRSSDRMGMESKGLVHKVGCGPGGSCGSRVVVGRPPSSATGFGAGGGRHGSVGAAGGPFASSASSVIGPSGCWRAGNTIGTSMSAMGMNLAVLNASASGYGRASQHGSVSASGTASPGGSTSAFTRYSNSSASTMATTVSEGSGKANWRNAGRGGQGGAVVAMTSSADADGTGAAGPSVVGGKTSPYAGVNPPKGLKTMDAVPCSTNELPRDQQSNPDFGATSVKKARTRNKKGINTNINNINGATSGASTATDTTPTIATDAGTTSTTSKDLNINGITNKLDTIIERPLTSETSIDATTTGLATGGSVPSTRKEASTSTTDLVAAATSSAAANGSAVNDDGTGGGRKKVHKSQITALAKVLSALRR